VNTAFISRRNLFMAADSSKTKPDGESDVWDAERLWIEGGEPRREMVSSFIACGDLVILAGAPKSGKSLLASQLCLQLLRGSGNLFGHPALAIKPASSERPGWRVLFVSLEMEPDAVWGRLCRQAEKLGVSILEIPGVARGFAKARPREGHKRNAAHSPLPLFHVFQINGEKSFSIRRRSQKSGVSLDAAARKCWRGIVTRVLPDVIVFDSLSQLHDCDENANIDMRHVLHELDSLCNYETSSGCQRPAKIIIHHTRKPYGDRSYGATAATSIRGASSIHAEADLAITITKFQGARRDREVMLTCSSRHAAQLDNFSLEREDEGLTYKYNDEETPRTARRHHEKLSAVHRILSSGKQNLTETEIIQGVALITRDRGTWARMLVKDLVRGGLLNELGQSVKGNPGRFALPPEHTRDSWMSLALSRTGTGELTSRSGRERP